MTVTEQLAQINAAIMAIESGAQEYAIGNRRLKRPDLVVLYKERRLLQQQLAQETSGDTIVAVFDRR